MKGTRPSLEKWSSWIASLVIAGIDPQSSYHRHMLNIWACQVRKIADQDRNDKGLIAFFNRGAASRYTSQSKSFIMCVIASI